ncbi:hypothetical protein EDB86DRAFT_226458 [Lactarius hatsudake]|nr:hypothetical protein EDB86DRAFT_226458 [Lactarius hatsudake]
MPTPPPFAALSRCKDSLGAGPEIIYFRSFRSRSSVAWPTAISDSRSHGVALRYRFPAIDSLLSLPSPRVCTQTHTHSLLPLVTSITHGPPSPVLALQEASQPLIARQRTLAPRAPLSIAFPSPSHRPPHNSFQDVKIGSQLNHAVRGRANHRARHCRRRRRRRRRTLLSCVILSRPSLFAILVCPYIFAMPFHLDA